ncbi:MAG: RNA 2',3'-cyclic phosphodiesterase [Candidatus Edwardsbacteria bacterium]
MPEETQRIFVAIELPNNIHQKIANLQKQLKLTGADVKWVEPENIHLTLKFLGNLMKEKIEILSLGVEEAVKNISNFQIALDRLGAFPSLRRVQIVWVGINEGEKEAINLQEKIEEKLTSLGFEKERRAFVPHLTIGRARSFKKIPELVKEIEKVNFSTEKFLVSSVNIMKSVLTPKGPIYTKLNEFKF